MAHDCMNVIPWKAKLEQLECLRSEDTPPPPPRLMITHTIESYGWSHMDPKSKEDKVKVTNLKNLPKFQSFEFWNKHYIWHTFWSCLIWCANTKWIRRVLLKIQSRHDSVHRRTDGKRWNQYTPLSTSLKRGASLEISSMVELTTRGLSQNKDIILPV